MKKNLCVLAICSLLNGCLGAPKHVTAVEDFELSRYLGTWYEIARLDHSFERGLSHVTAEYSLSEDGSVQVVNRGFHAKKNKWKEAKGKAKFVNASDTGHLKVSFFGPFYGAYIVFELDKDAYQYAFVSGPNTSYLWFLSRTPTISTALKNQFIAQAKAAGFDTDALVFVTQD